MKGKPKFQYWHLACLGFTIWMIGTWHGGWSITPQSTFEKMTDAFGLIMMMWGIMGDIQDVNTWVWVDWRRESVIIGAVDEVGPDSTTAPETESCEIGYKDLQALIFVLRSSTGDRTSRFLEWKRKKKQ